MVRCGADGASSARYCFISIVFFAFVACRVWGCVVLLVRLRWYVSLRGQRGPGVVASRRAEWLSADVPADGVECRVECSTPCFFVFTHCCGGGHIFILAICLLRLGQFDYKSFSGRIRLTCGRSFLLSPFSV